MPKIVFVQPDATSTTIVAVPGVTAMQAARDNNVPGIKAECGGECSCSTCHCYVDAAWAKRLPPKQDDEASMVEFAWEPKDTSRLACQIRLTEALDGLVLHIPARQL